MPLITKPNHIYNRTNKDTHRTSYMAALTGSQSLYKQANSDARSLFNRDCEAPTANLDVAHKDSLPSFG